MPMVAFCKIWHTLDDVLVANDVGDSDCRGGYNSNWSEVSSWSGERKKAWESPSRSGYRGASQISGLVSFPTYILTISKGSMQGVNKSLKKKLREHKSKCSCSSGMDAAKSCWSLGYGSVDCGGQRVIRCARTQFRPQKDKQRIYYENDSCRFCLPPYLHLKFQ